MATTKVTNVYGETRAVAGTGGPETASDAPSKNGIATMEGMVGAEDPYKDLEKVNARLEKRLTIDRFTRSMFERGWFRNCLFLVGQQSIIFDGGKWRLRRLPVWYPRAQTNKFREKARDIISAVLQGRVPIRYTPATDDPSDAGTAEVGERVREVIYAESQLDEKENELATWFVTTGNAFVVPYYDYDEKHGMMRVPKLQCAACGATYSSTDDEIDGEAPMCPECAAQGVQAPLTPTVDAENADELADADDAQVDLLPIGKLCADVVSPFEIRCDHRIRDTKEWSWFVRVRRYDAAFAKDKFGYQGGATDKGDEGNTQSQHYLDVLAQITDAFNPSPGMVSNSGAGSGGKIPKVTAYEFRELPSEDYPEGIYCVRIGNSAADIVECGPLQDEYGAGVRKGQKFLALADFRAEIVPGRYWGDTPMNDAVPLQIFRNVAESALRLSIQRMANSTWLNPKGSGVTNWNGEPGWVCDYNPVSLGGNSFAKPERIPADMSNVQGFIELLKFIDDAIERVTGTFFLQGGTAPAGVTAASALAYLGERAAKSMSPLTRQWAKGFLRFEQLALEIARKNWTESRIRVVAGKNKKWKTEKFLASDLQGAVNMVIDYESLQPKSAATSRAEIGQLVQFGVVSPQDPQQKMQILKKFGELSLLGSMDLDVEEAAKEADGFLTKQQAPRLVPLVQNSWIHMMEHADFAKTDEFKELPPEQQDVWYAHIQAHAVDIGERTALFMSLQQDPEGPLTMNMATGEAQAATQGGQQGAAQGINAQNNVAASTQPGSQVGSMVPPQGGGPGLYKGKGTVGAGPNQAQAQQARGDATTRVIPDIGATIRPK